MNNSSQNELLGVPSDDQSEARTDESATLADSLTAHLMEAHAANPVENMSVSTGDSSIEFSEESPERPIPLHVFVGVGGPRERGLGGASEQSATQLMRLMSRKPTLRGGHLPCPIRRQSELSGDSSMDRLHEDQPSAQGYSTSDTHSPVDPQYVMQSLHVRMANSSISQKMLQSWDKKNGLPRSHAQTMINTARSRRQLQEGVILKKWDGSPLIGADGVTTDPSPRRKSGESRKKQPKTAPTTIADSDSVVLADGKELVGSDTQPTGVVQLASEKPAKAEASFGDTNADAHMADTQA